MIVDIVASCALHLSRRCFSRSKAKDEEEMGLIQTH
jgi:hypothetical protein